MGIRIEAPKQDGNARFETLKVNLTENLAATRGVVTDNEGNFYYGVAISGSAGSGSSFPFTGSAIISGSLTVTGSVYAPDITGSLFGTSSWAQNAITASYITASNVYGPFGSNSVISASYSITSSFATTASYGLSASFSATSSFAISASNSLTASYVNTLNQNVIITGSLAVGSGSIGAGENTLILGPAPAGGAGEGGQILLSAKGDGYTSASMWDNYQNQTRLLRGSNAGSDAVVAQWNMHTKQAQFPAYNSLGAFSGTPVAALGIDSSGYIITIQTGSQAGGSGVVINNNTDNYLLTATGTANTINGEGNLQFNGSTLSVTGNVTATSITSSTGFIALANGAMYFRGGDDAEFWDINVVNTVGIYGQQDATVASIKLGSNGGILSGRSSSIGINTTLPNSGSLHVNGNVFAASFTGSLLGTSSWAQNTLTASFVTASNVFGPFGSNSILSSSFAVSSSLAQSSSFATTASFATSASFTQTASFATSSSFTTTASFALSASQAISSSFSTTSSFAISSSFSISASFTISSSFATSASLAQTASFITASNVFGPFGSNSVLSSSFATSSSFAQSSSFATSTSFAISASQAATSSFSLTASYVNPLRQIVQITGSLAVTGSAAVTGSLGISGSITINTNGENRVLASTFRPAGAVGSNLFIGHAGTTNTGTGANSSYNTSVGIAALDSNTTGYVNTAVGMSALTSNNTGFSNSAVGYISLQSVTNGSNNAALGDQSLYLLNGSFNTAVGSLAGGNVQIATASVYIGYNALGSDGSGTATTNNEIVIGANNTGLGSNTVVLGNSSIVRTLLRKNVGIDTTNPLAALDVNGMIIGGTSSSVDGAAILVGKYSPNLGHLTTFGSNQSSGGPVIGYNVYPSSSFNHFISSITSSISIARSAFAIDSSFRWYTGVVQAVNIGLSASLSQRMILTNTGNLGIGVASPSLALEVSGSASITGSLNTSGIITAPGVTASLFGTASWAQNVLTASFVTGSNVFGPFGSNSILSSSFATSASLAQTASFTISSSFARSASLAQTASFTISSSFATSASLAQTASFTISASFATSASLAQTASFTISSSFATSASLAQTASFITSSRVFGPFGANSVLSSSFAVSASWAPSAGLSGGTTNVVPLWTSPTTLGASVISQSSGNIGIGTSNPTGKLEINNGVANGSGPALVVSGSGDIRVTDGGSIFFGAYDYGASTYIRGFDNSAILDFVANGTRMVSITSTGVGIGNVPSPSVRLEVSGSSGELVRLRSAAKSNWIGFFSGSTSLGYVGYGSTLNDSLTLMNYQNAAVNIGTNSAVVMVVTGNNVGIGTTSPSARLTVAGNGTGTALIGDLFGSGNYTGISLNGLSGTTTYNLLSGISDQNLYINRPAGYEMYFRAGNANQVIISGSGNVGIGTTTPIYKLVISNAGANGLEIDPGTVVANRNLLINFNRSTSAYTAIQIDASTTILGTRGNVGINTDSPTYKLDISGSARTFNSQAGGGINIIDLQNTDNTAGVTHLARFGVQQQGSGVGRTLLYAASPDSSNTAGDLTILTENGGSIIATIGKSGTNNTISLYNSGSPVLERVRLHSAGNSFFTGGDVAIGISVPTARLHVSGTTGAIFEVDGAGTAGANALYVNSSGNVGIATASPSYRLDVSGSARISGSLAVGNILPNATVGRIDAANDVVAFSTSDIRFKTNLTPIDNAIDKITTISGYEFDWIPNQEYHGYEGRDVGIIAQEIEKVLPQVVTTRDSGYKAVKYEKIVPLLIQAIKEQQTQIDELRYLLQNKT